MTTQDGYKKAGLGGWLAVYLVYSLIYAINYFLEWGYVVYEWYDRVFYGIFAVFYLITSLRLMLKRPHAVLQVKWLLTVEMITYAALMVLGAIALFIYSDAGYRLTPVALFLQETSLNALIPWIWLFYFMRSRRVRNTFGEEAASAPDPADKRPYASMWTLGFFLVFIFVGSYLIEEIELFVF